MKDGEYYYKSFRDAMWLKIFDHNLNGSNDFADENEALSCSKPYKYRVSNVGCSIRILESSYKKLKHTY